MERNYKTVNKGQREKGERYILMKKHSMFMDNINKMSFSLI